MGRPPCCDKANVKRGPWTPEEDAKILAYVASHGIGNWTLVPQKAGLNRCGKSCRLRWTNYLRPDLKQSGFTQEEEECIVEMHRTIGSRWSLIARRLPGRTDNDVKNYWNTKLKKKLIKMGIDPITHKPFSQLLSEYGKISGSPITTNTNPFLQENVVVQKIEHFTTYEASSINQENVEPPCSFNEATSEVTPFSCNDYIMGEPSIECKTEDGCSEIKSCKIVESCCDGSSSSAADTFVEEMLARDMEMRLQFPQLFNENYDY